MKLLIAFILNNFFFIKILFLSIILLSCSQESSPPDCHDCGECEKAPLIAYVNIAKNNFEKIHFIDFNYENNYLYLEFNRSCFKKEKIPVTLQKKNHLHYSITPRIKAGINNSILFTNKNEFYERNKKNNDFSFLDAIKLPIKFYDADNNFVFQITNQISKICNPIFDDNEKIIKGTITIDEAFINNPVNGTKSEN